MADGDSAGARLRAAWREERPLQIVGAIHAYGAIMAESMGFRALYLSGAGVATASFGLPDLGMTNLSDVVEDARRITGATSLPVLVDIDTGWGSPLTVARAVREMTRAGVAAVHIEDQVTEKRCGHRPQTRVVPAEEMIIRIRAAVDARTDPEFVVVARTDAYASEGMDGVVERAGRYVEAGADMIFPDALTESDHYRRLAAAIDAPVLANMTEFGRTPLMDLEVLAACGVAVVLYPLSAFRAMNAAALEVYKTIRTGGTQRALIDRMQTREEMYRLLDYEQYERRIEQWLDR